METPGQSTIVDSPERRLRVSLALKAARYLAGSQTTDSKGNPKASPLPVEKLVKLEPLARNGITKNQVEDIEQMKVFARPMVLERIAEALNVAPAFLDADADGQLDVVERISRRQEYAVRILERVAGDTVLEGVLADFPELRPESVLDDVSSRSGAN